MRQVLFTQKDLLVEMTAADLKKKYFGSVLGLMWSFINPLATTLILFIVYSIGFRTPTVAGEMPFSFWLFAGLIPWFFFSEAIMSALTCFYEYSFLIKKIVFPTHLIPLVKLLSALVIHLFLTLVCVLLFSIFYQPPGSAILLMPLNIVLLFFLCLGPAYFLSSSSVFTRDVREMMGVVLQLFFWGTPIFWKPSMIPAEYHFIIDWNPLYHIVRVYRYAYSPKLAVHELLFSYGYVIFISFVLLGIGIFAFRRTKDHFVDVL